LQIEGNAIKVDSMMQTSRPGIFAAGDICTYPGKLKLIATGFGEACTAVNYAKHYLDPSANIFPGHSSNMKEEKKGAGVVAEGPGGNEEIRMTKQIRMIND